MSIENNVPSWRVNETGHGYVRDVLSGREGILLASSGDGWKDVHWLDEEVQR